MRKHKDMMRIDFRRIRVVDSIADFQERFALFLVSKITSTFNFVFP